MESKQSHQRAVILAERVKKVISIIPENIEDTTRKKPGFLVNVILPYLMRLKDEGLLLELSQLFSTSPEIAEVFNLEDLSRVYRLVSYCQCYTDEQSRKIAEEATALYNWLEVLLISPPMFNYIAGVTDEPPTSPGMKFNTSTPTNKNLYDSQYLATFKTSTGSKIIEGLLRAGIIEEAGEGWKWKGGKRLFAYFCVEVSRGDVLDLRPESNNLEWIKLKPLFGVNADLRGYVSKNFVIDNCQWVNKPKGSRKIDNIIKEALKDEKENIL